MLLAIDAGNTNIVFALVDDRGTIKTRWRIATDPRRTADEYAVWLHQLLAMEGYETSDVLRVTIGTVVPRALHNLTVLSQKYFHQTPLVAGQSGWPIELDVAEPATVGADRALNAIAGHALHKGDLIIVDFGTATTFDVVDFSGAYKGGIIAPGINLSLDALVSAAARLPRIAIEVPAGNSVIGRTTEMQMLIGVYWGYVAMIEGLVERLKAEIGRPAHVIATGGLAILFDKNTDVFDLIEPDLTIQGLALLAAEGPDEMTPGEELLFLALGGSGEIGMNVNLYGTRGKWLMVDLGLTFADTDYPGIDLILPELEFIEQRRDELVGIVLTHGHEDHIGAIPYLAADLKVPLYATPFTAALIAGKLEEEGLTGKVKVHIIDRDGSIDLDPFKITFKALAHSIPEGNGLVIETPHGTIFHTGDWKIDETPVLGQMSSDQVMHDIGDSGILALVCDSTNVFQDAPSGSEAGVHDGLRQAVEEAKGRVLVTTFASNAARLQTLGRVAIETGRKMCVAGRSLDRILRVAKENGYLLDFPETVRFDEAMRLPRGEVMILATGGQGEPRAALSRVAFGSHELKLVEGDTVIFSSKQIPGNEIAIGRIMNALSDLGAITVTDRQLHIHVSGHPGRPELAQMYQWIRPQIVVPVHGEARHMAEQARFALACGVPKSIYQKNGDVIRLAPKGPKKVGTVRTGRLVLDGDVILTADGGTINERRKIAVNGIIAVALPLTPDGRLAGKPLVRPLGVPVEADRDDFIADATDAATRAFGDSIDSDKVRESVRLAVRRCANLWTGKKPIVEVMGVSAAR